MSGTESPVSNRLKLVGCASLIVAVPGLFLAAAYVLDQLISAEFRHGFVSVRGSLAIGLGACAVGYGSWLASRSAEQFLRWKSIDAKVTRAEIHEVQVECGHRANDIAGGPHNCQWQTQYRVDLRYEYEVAGEAYTGEWRTVPYVRGVRFQGPNFTERRDAEAMIHQRPAGSSITVFYNPNDPSQSTVQRGFFSRGAVFVLAGIAACVVGWFLQ